MSGDAKCNPLTRHAWRWWCVVMLCAATWLAPHAAAQEARLVKFNRDVRPILADTCFKCHGFDKHARKAGLRLDTLEDAQAPRKSGVPIVPGKPAESLVYQRLVTKDAEERMPPADSNLTLSQEQKDLIKRWIEQGAKYEPHWAFIPPVRPRLPDAKGSASSNQPIDRIVAARLVREGLKLSPRADKATLLRRVTLDLTGLPPTLAEVDAFLADESPDAYAKVVDRLLASKRYGERMAWDWLEAARYADSNGYQGDGERTMWPWRDWVIDAFNGNMPYDKFTVWQIAGDLLQDEAEKGLGKEGQGAKGQGPGEKNTTGEDAAAPGPWPLALSRRLATGFNRNHMINGEGGRIAEENRVEYIFDQLETVGTVWMGLTFNCCRCHDHKFDPLLRKDYYSLFAFFNQTPVTGGGGNPATPPIVEVFTEEQKAKIVELEGKVETLARQSAERAIELTKDQAKREAEALAQLDKPMWRAMTPTSAKSAGGQKLEILEDQSILASGDNPAKDTYTLTFTTDVQRITGLRLEALRHESMTSGGLARSDSGNFVLTEIEVAIGDKRVKIASADATFEQDGFKVAGAFDGKANTGWAVWAGKPLDRSHEAVFRFAEPVAVAAGGVISVTLRHDSPHASHNLGHFRLSVTDDPQPTLPAGREGLVAALRTAADKRTKEQADLVTKHLRETDDVSRQLKQQLDQANQALQATRNSGVKVMVMADMDKPRKTFMLTKGIYTEPTDEVTAATPEKFPPMPDSAPRNRLGLAQWLVSRDNPLTARVTVNRFWQQFFGIGLVKTVEDFGTQGETPIHQDLLDWLAVEFIESGWDVKHLCKLIVMSDVYCQSSKVTSDLFERDPANRLLARGPRFRMPSWMLRDQALAASGAMVDTLGGPPVKPYQPAGIWAEATFGNKRYVQEHGDALYRRSLYTFWRRIVGPTMFFDAAARQTCTVKVTRTNTPLHALTTLNDETFVEAARIMAQRVLTSTGPGDADRIDMAFRLVLSRKPGDAERAVLINMLKRLNNEFAGDRDAAVKYLAIGESKRDEKLDPVEHAAYAALCLAILNLDEALTKE